MTAVPKQQPPLIERVLLSPDELTLLVSVADTDAEVVAFARSGGLGAYHVAGLKHLLRVGVLATSVFTTSATLDPGAPNRSSANPSSGLWNIWGIGLLVLSAGCYELDATWSGGGWRTVYAAGS